MFLHQLLKSNPALLQYAKELHENGTIMPDTYLIDVDTVLDNARRMLECAKEQDVELLFMLKQLGRNSYLAKKLIEIGYTGAVVVDFKEAQVMLDHHIPLGNVGHLVQIPTHQLRRIIASQPNEITVYSFEKIKQIQEIAKDLNIHVSITLKVLQHQDVIYESQKGGFFLDDLHELVMLCKSFTHVHMEGVTAFPCFLYDEDKKEMQETANAHTVVSAKKILEELGCTIKHVNMPSATCLKTLPMIHALGGNQAEPGHAFSGTTPFHQHHQDYEKIAYVYVSEVAHQVDNRSYVYGGGYYRRGHLQHVLVNDEILTAYPIADSAIDYHIEIDKGKSLIGDCALFCFRTQMFVTRSDIVLVEGLSTQSPHIVGRYDSLGKKIA